MNWLPHLSRPLWLLSLPLLALLLWLLWRHRPRQGQWQQLLPDALQPWLLIDGQQRRRHPSGWWLLASGWLLAVLVLAGPGWQRLEQPLSGRGEALVVMIELTPAMLAADLAPTRLEQVRRKLLDLLEVRAQAPTALIVYAGSAHVLMPLSEDPATAHNLLAALHPSLMPLPGQRADLAVERALALLDQGANGHGRLLLLSGQLSADEQRALRRLLDRRNNPLAIIGVGTTHGAPVDDPQGGLLRDRDGAILLPRLDEASLVASADAYQRLSLDDQDLQALGLHTQALSDTPAARAPLQTVQGWADQGHWLLLALLLLAAFAARRGWLLILALLILPPTAEAEGFEALWLRADQRGLRLLQADRPQQAARQFRDPLWRGIAHLRAGDYAAAAQAFAAAPGALAHYNRGHALVLAGEYPAALQAWRQALDEDPALVEARDNLALLERWLAAQPAPERDPPRSPSTLAQVPSPPASSKAVPEVRPHRPAGQQAADADLPGQAPGARPPSQALPSVQTPDADPRDPRASTLGRPTRDTRESPQSLDEQQQALEHWLRQIPDDPAELLQRMFWQELQQRQDNPR